MLESILDKAHVYFVAGELRKAREVLSTGLPLAEEEAAEEPALLRARLYANLAAVCTKILDVDPANRHIEDAERLARTIEPPPRDLIAGLHNLRGILKKFAGDHDGALECFDRVKEQLPSIEDESARGVLHQMVVFNTARLHLLEGHFNKVAAELAELNFADETRTEMREVGEARHSELQGFLVMQVLEEPVQMGPHKRQILIEQSIEHFGAARRIYRELRDRHQVWLCDLQLLRLEFCAGKAGERQEEILRKAEKFARHGRSAGMLSQTDVLRVEYYVAAGRTRAARSLILKLLDYPPEIPRRNLVPHYGRLRKQAEAMCDEELIKKLERAIDAIASEDAGSFKGTML